MPQKAGKRNPYDAGKRRPRHKPERFAEPIPDDPVRRALSGEVTEAEWESLRVPAWKKWYALVTSEPDDEWRRWRARYWEDPRIWTPETDHLYHEPERTPDSARPPGGARHDGIEGQALNRYWPPEGGFDARPKIIELAEVGLAEVERFRRRPEAKEIRGPLRHYAKLLRQVRDEPERRICADPARRRY